MIAPIRNSPHRNSATACALRYRRGLSPGFGTFAGQALSLYADRLEPAGPLRLASAAPYRVPGARDGSAVPLMVCSGYMNEVAGLDGLLEPFSRCLDTESAQRVTEFRVDPAVQARIDLLAERANDGVLTDEERSEYTIVGIFWTPTTRPRRSER